MLGEILLKDNIKNYIYIVAGDEMKKLMSARFPERIIVPFCEDFSKGSCNYLDLNDNLLSERATFWHVSKSQYIEKLLPIINLDMSKDYILCFGDDACCNANLKFMVNYLKYKGYSKKIKIQILNEYNLKIKKEYFIKK